MASNSSFCLFLGDLSLFCTEKDILAAFSPFGRVTNVRIKRSNENKKHLLYGFVEYASASEAVQAMQAMNNSLFLGRILKVRWASNKQGKRVKMDEGQQHHGPSVFVVFLVYSKQKVVNEIALRSVFEAFGAVDDVVVKQSKVDPMTGQQKGYAFVQYTADWAGIDAATTAVANLDNVIIDGVGYKCEVSYNTEELRRHLLASGVPPPNMTAPMSLPPALPMHTMLTAPPMQPTMPPTYNKQPSPVSHVHVLGAPMIAPHTTYKMEAPSMQWGATTYPPAMYHPTVLVPAPSTISMPMGMSVPYYSNSFDRDDYNPYAPYANTYRSMP